MTMFAPVSIFGTAILPIWLVVIALVLGTFVEGGYLIARGQRFDAKDALVNLVLYGGNVLVLAFWSPWLFLIYDAMHDHALFDLGSESKAPSGLVLLLLVVAEDLCFYVFHRSSHRIRLLWAAHEPHHSSTSFNWSVALRQTWTPFLAAPFWLVLPLTGFDPLMVLSAQAASLLFQSLLHTELVGKLGVIGWVFNTPGHHRVHHGLDEEFVDKNFGGIFIVWDRLFGTFHDGTPATYGTGVARYNPLSASLHEWRELVRDVARSRSAGAIFGTLFREPGWRASFKPKDG